MSRLLASPEKLARFMSRYPDPAKVRKLLKASEDEREAQRFALEVVLGEHDPTGTGVFL